MTLNASKVEYSGGGQVEPLEPGNYPARVVQVIDLGLQAQRPYEGQEKPPAFEIMVTYELGTEFLLTEEGEEDRDKPRWVSERFGLYSLKSDKAKSTKRMLVLDPDLVAGGDWSRMVDHPCLVAVVNNQNKRTGKIYNNVGGISPPIKGMDVAPLVNVPKTFDLDDPDMDIFNSLPEWIQTIIKENLNYRGSALEARLEADATPPNPEIPVGEDEDVPY